MSSLLKGILILLFFSLLIGLISLLPSTSDYPLDPMFASGVATIFGYYFAWSSVFTCLNTLLALSLLSIGLVLVFAIAKFVMWVISFTSRLVG